MKQPDIRLATLLTYSGALPFILAVLLSYFSPADADWASPAIMAYGALIISFLCGIHWAAYLFFSGQCRLPLLLASNIITLTAWGSLMVSEALVTYTIQVACFLTLFAVDALLHRAGIIPLWFYHLRRNATVVVVVCLVQLVLFS